MRYWGIPNNFGCMDTKNDDGGREFFDGSVPGFVKRGTRFGKSIGSGWGTKVKRVNRLEGVQNVDMSSWGCSRGGCRRISLKFLQDGGERLEHIGQSSRVNRGSHSSTKSTTFEAKVLGSNGQRRLADIEPMENSRTKRNIFVTQLLGF